MGQHQRGHHIFIRDSQLSRGTAPLLKLRPISEDPRLSFQNVTFCDNFRCHLLVRYRARLWIALAQQSSQKAPRGSQCFYGGGDYPLFDDIKIIDRKLWERCYLIRFSTLATAAVRGLLGPAC